MLAWCSFYSDTAPSGNTSAPGRPERARAATTPHSGHGSANSTSSRCSSSRSRDGSAGSWSNVASAAPPSKSERLHSGRPSPPERRRTQPIPGSTSRIEHRSCSDNCNAVCCQTKTVEQHSFSCAGETFRHGRRLPGVQLFHNSAPSTAGPATSASARIRPRSRRERDRRISS